MLLSCSIPSSAQLTRGLGDEYLQTQLDWAMFIDLQEIQHYLNYEGTRLWPLARGRVYFRVYPHNGEPIGKSQAKIYKEFWYRKGMPIGLRCRNQLNIERDKTGIIVVSEKLNNSDNIRAATDVIVRLILELQFQSIITSIVQVPLVQFDQFASCLSHYGFNRLARRSSGQQLSIHLRSNPPGKDDHYYLYY